MNRFLLLFLFLAALLLLGAGTGLAADWPRFLGPNGDATSTESRLVDALPTNGLPIIWEKSVGTGYAAPSVQGTRLVLFHRQKDEEILECLTVDNGKSLWRAATPTRYQDPYGYNNGPRCTPLVTSNRVFTYGAEGRLVCRELDDGREIWARDTAKDFNVPEAFFGVGSTPILEGGRLLVMVGGQPNSGVVALDPDTGRTLWQSVGETNWTGQSMLGWPGEPPVQWKSWDKTASYASLQPATIHGRRLVFALMRQGLVALDPTDGRVRFSRWFRARVDESVNAMTPLIHGNEVLISSAYYRSGSVLLRVAQDTTQFTEVWKGLGLEMHWSQPILVGDHLYGFSGRNEPDAVLRCVDYATGRVAWERTERWRPHSADQPDVFGRGSLILADGKLIALGEGGLLGLFRPNAGRCEELGRWQVPSLKFPCWAGPVLSGGRLFLRSEDRLVCVNVSRAK
jgi:outer membrane protein assembly factor BamB